MEAILVTFTFLAIKLERPELSRRNKKVQEIHYHLLYIMHLKLDIKINQIIGVLI